MEKRFEALWYNKLPNESEEQAMMAGDWNTKEFYNRKQALAFYEKHKNDSDKCGWWITRRNSDWEVIEDIII